LHLASVNTDLEAAAAYQEQAMPKVWSRNNSMYCYTLVICFNYSPFSASGRLVTRLHTDTLHRPWGIAQGP
jgi:hypothetical protein